MPPTSVHKPRVTHRCTHPQCGKCMPTCRWPFVFIALMYSYNTASRTRPVFSCSLAPFDLPSLRHRLDGLVWNEPAAGALGTRPDPTQPVVCPNSDQSHLVLVAGVEPLRTPSHCDVAVSRNGEQSLCCCAAGYGDVCTPGDDNDVLQCVWASVVLCVHASVVVRPATDGVVRPGVQPMWTAAANRILCPGIGSVRPAANRVLCPTVDGIICPADHGFVHPGGEQPVRPATCNLFHGLEFMWSACVQCHGSQPGEPVQSSQSRVRVRWCRSKFPCCLGHGLLLPGGIHG
jgi:hypothetical protein